MTETDEHTKNHCWTSKQMNDSVDGSVVRSQQKHQMRRNSTMSKCPIVVNKMTHANTHTEYRCNATDI